MVWSNAEFLAVCFEEESHEKHQKEYSQFLVEIGPEAFKRALLTLRNGITTGWKRVGMVSKDITKARESILEEKNWRECELKITSLVLFEHRKQDEEAAKSTKKITRAKKWMRAYKKLKAWVEIVISSDNEEELAMQVTLSSASEPSTLNTVGAS